LHAASPLAPSSTTTASEVVGTSGPPAANRYTDCLERLVKAKTLAMEQVKQKAEEGVVHFLQLSQDAGCSLLQKAFCEEPLEKAKEVLVEAEESDQCIFKLIIIVGKNIVVHYSRNCWAHDILAVHHHLYHCLGVGGRCRPWLTTRLCRSC
jgi:hypothetical protein